MAEHSKTDTDNESQLRLANQLCFALYSTSRAITKQYALHLKNMGITYPQYLALLVLWESDGLSVQGMANKLELDGATMTPIIQRLEKLELVKRQRSTEDERRVHVFLTREGRELHAKATKLPETIRKAIGVDEKKARQLINQAERIKNYIAQHSSNEGP